MSEAAGLSVSETVSETVSAPVSETISGSVTGNGTATESSRTAVQHRIDFHWEHVGADWHVLLYLLAALALGWWAFRRYGPAPAGWPGRIARSCRWLAIVLVVIMAAGPSWRDTSITAIPGRLLVAVDRSASMARADGPQGQPRIAITKDLASGLLALGEQRELIQEWRSVGGVGDVLDRDALVLEAPSTPGSVSPLGDELQRLADAGRCDHLILVSDGRVTTGTDLASLGELLRERAVGLSILAVGGIEVDAALWIDQLVVNRNAALNEREPVLVRLTGRALAADQPVRVRISIDGTDIDTTEAERTADSETTSEWSARLSAQFPHEGESILRVEASQGDLREVREVRIQVTERRLKVLILDSRPRYELRYLREALRRDQTIVLHAYLGDGRHWRRWSDLGPDDHLPLTSAEVRDYDVILLGDVGPDQFTDEQLRAVEDAVRKQGAGLIWLLGETGASSAFARHPLGELLPTRLPASDALSRGFLEQKPRRPQRTEAALAIGLFDPGDIPWHELPPLLGAAPLGELRPASEILMKDQDDAPLVVSRAYPPGVSIVVAVEDTWRWRRNVGDTYLQRFHGQLLRFASSGRRLGSHHWRLSATPRRAVPGETLTLTMTPIGPRSEGPAERVVAALVGPDGAELIVPLLAADDGFSATVQAPSAGSWRLRVVDGVEERLVDAGELDVQPPGAELRDPRADPDGLAGLARATGGRVYIDAAALLADLPDLARDRVETLPPRGLWDTAWAFLALLILLSVEWSLRRWKRLP